MIPPLPHRFPEPATAEVAAPVRKASDLAATLETPPTVRTLVVTGADDRHFANATVLFGSWVVHMRHLPLVVCDFGLRPEQREVFRGIEGVELLTCGSPIHHPWQGKSMIGRFLETTRTPWENMMWVDADAFFAHPVPDPAPLLDGYDMLIDAHVMSVGAIVHDCNLEQLPLRRDDAYFSAGWWVVRRGCLLNSFERLTRRVIGQGNLWENDAFVAAIYEEKLKIRTVCGGIWHARGMTSLRTCQVDGTAVLHEGQRVYVVHANAEYTVREDGRRVLLRPELAQLQNHYEAIGVKHLVRTSSAPNDSGTAQGTAPGPIRGG